MSDYGFQLSPEIVRVDIFKSSGKWYTTLELKFDNYLSEKESIQTTFRRCMQEQHKGYSGLTAVCLAPYHEHSHPLMITL